MMTRVRSVRVQPTSARRTSLGVKRKFVGFGKRIGIRLRRCAGHDRGISCMAWATAGLNASTSGDARRISTLLESSKPPNRLRRRVKAEHVRDAGGNLALDDDSGTRRGPRAIAGLIASQPPVPPGKRPQEVVTNRRFLLAVEVRIRAGQSAPWAISRSAGIDVGAGWKKQEAVDGVALSPAAE